MAKRVGFRAIYLSGGGVAASSLGMPDLGISTLDDVLTDVRRITDVCELPLLVDVDTGFGAARSTSRAPCSSLIKVGAAAMHIEDQVGAEALRPPPRQGARRRTDEMVDRIKAAVDARTDASFVIMARTDALAVEGLDAAIERARRLRRGRRRHDLPRGDHRRSTMYRRSADAVKVPVLANITEFGTDAALHRRRAARRRRRHRAVSAVGASAR